MAVSSTAMTAFNHMGSAQIQGEMWGAKAEDWAEIQEPAWRPLYEKVMSLAEIRAGMKLLDVGCGAGGALTVARDLGAEVAGLDAASALVDIARRRLANARIEVGEMEELPFASNMFDIVTGINSFQFAGDIVQALKEARRVTKPGGRVVMLVWGKRDDCELLSATLPAVLALLPAAPQSANAPLPLAEAGIIEGLMNSAGLSPIYADEIDHTLVYPDMERAWRAFAAAAPCVRAVRHAGEDVVRNVVQATLPPFQRADGSVAQKNRFRIVMGEKS
jgi:SAM-dependent methyltransferase